MSRESFLATRERAWKRCERTLARLGRGRRRMRGRADLDALPALYRRVSQDLALAQHRRHGLGLVERLNRLALRCHEELYRGEGGFRARFVEFVAWRFPRAVRERGGTLLVGALLFYGPFLGMMLVALAWPEWVYMTLDPETVASVEEMYDPEADRVGEGRGSESDVAMFGLYVYNNVGIGFRTFAGGLLFGVGAIFFLFYNGLVIGSIFGHLHRIGYAETLDTFVIGHGAFELNAIVLFGVAGLRLGLALLSPGRRSRARALVEEGRESLVVVYGAAGMLLLAAFVEAFWSPSSAPAGAKYAVGAALWTLVLGYFAFCGRKRGA